MKTVAVDIREYFRPITGQRPWRAHLGVGSFLLFDFGARVKEDHHFRGEWHLWIFQANWILLHGDRTVADSDSVRQAIALAIQRLESCALTHVKFDPEKSVTEFIFGDFRLVVSPADYLENPDERDNYWLFFMPDDTVLSVGPNGVNLGPSDR